MAVHTRIRFGDVEIPCTKFSFAERIERDTERDSGSQNRRILNRGTFEAHYEFETEAFDAFADLLRMFPPLPNSMDLMVHWRVAVSEVVRVLREPGARTKNGFLFVMVSGPRMADGRWSPHEPRPRIGVDGSA